RVLDGAEFCERTDVDAQLAQGRARIFQQAPLEAGIDPGPCHDLGAQRGGAAVHEIDLGSDLLRGEHAFLDQQQTDGLLKHLVGAGRTRVMILLEGSMVMTMIRSMTVLVLVVMMLGIMHGRPPTSLAPASARRCRLPTRRRRAPSSDP